MSEIVRAAIASIPKGQWEAAYATGMTPVQALRRTILPQAARIALPSLGNSFIGLVKDTSLCTLIGVNEIMNGAKSIAFADYQPMAVFVLVAGIYFVMSYPLSLAVRAMERRLNISR